MINISIKLFRKFNENGILYCNWKGTANLENGLEGYSDIDILISKEHRDFAENLLVESGFIKVNTQWICRFKAVYDWIGFDAVTGKLIHVHVHYRMIAGHTSTMEYTLPWSETVLSERILLDNSVYTISPCWEMILFLLRIGLEYPNKKVDMAAKSLRESSLSEYHYLQKHISWTSFDIKADTIFKEDSEDIKIIARNENLGGREFLLLHKISVNHINGIFYNKLYKLISFLKIDIFNHFSPFIGKFLWIPQKKTLPKGIVIAFLGQDGSGKSTVTKDIVDWLGWKLEVRRYYLGSGEEYYYPWQKRVLKVIGSKGKILFKPIRSWLYFSYYLASARYVYKTICAANHYASKGGIALLDRFPQLQFDGVNDGPKIRSMLSNHVPNHFKWILNYYAKKEEKILERATKLSPPLIIKLILTPEESLRRKPFENRELVFRKHEIIKALKYQNSQVVSIDAEQSYETEILQIKGIVWKRIKG